MASAPPDRDGWKVCSVCKKSVMLHRLNGLKAICDGGTTAPFSESYIYEVRLSLGMPINKRQAHKIVGIKR